jgi:hypothetical protein
VLAHYEEIRCCLVGKLEDGGMVLAEHDLDYNAFASGMLATRRRSASSAAVLLALRHVRGKLVVHRMCHAQPDAVACGNAKGALDGAVGPRGQVGRYEDVFHLPASVSDVIGTEPSG